MFQTCPGFIKKKMTKNPWHERVYERSWCWISCYRDKKIFLQFVPFQFNWYKHLNSFLVEDKEPFILTHWGRVLHISCICISNLAIIGSDNGLSPCRRQTISCTNAGILKTGPLGTNFSEISIQIHTFSIKKMHFKRLSGKWQPFCLGLSVVSSQYYTMAVDDLSLQGARASAAMVLT